MGESHNEDGLSIRDEDEVDAFESPAADGAGPQDRPADGDLEALRDAFVEAFNARDLDEIVGLVADDIECPDIRNGDGVGALTEELEAIWERSPGAVLTRAFLEAEPCAVGWLPDEEGSWSRAALVCFDAEDGLLTLVELPDDADALDRVEAEEPTGEELEEWADWAEWDRGEETFPRGRR